MLTFGSLFTGIGGFDLGLERAGMKCAFQVEIDTNCRTVLRRHYPDVERFLDVKQCGKHELPVADVLCGGFPCQDLSIAGRRSGLDGERSGLWYEFHRIITETWPRLVVIENVPGLLSSDGGRDFAIVVGGLTGWIPQVPDGGWGNAGFFRGRFYHVAYRILDAQFFGVAQRRRRVFIVASLGDGRCAEILFEQAGGYGDIAPSRKAQQAAAATVGCVSPGSSRHAAGNGNELSHLVSRSLTHYAGRNDPTSETFVFESRIARNGRGASESISPPLKAESGKTGKGDSAPLIGFYAHRTIATPLDDLSPTIAVGSAFHPPAIGGQMGVRRLTPVETCRLQGFPDDWNEWGVNRNGERVELSDSARYKQCGNAVCVNVIEWIGKQIVKVYADA